jgi:hypothetical protein
MSNAVHYVKSHLTRPGVTGWILRVGLYCASNVKPVDRNGKADPYAVIFVNGIRKRKSPVIKQTLHPQWHTVIDVVIDKDDLGATSLLTSSLSIALYDKDRFGTHDFLGAVKLSGDDFLQFVCTPLKHLPAWEVTKTSRIKKFPLVNVEPHPYVPNLKGTLSFWAELQLNGESKRLIAALKIQALKRGRSGREYAQTHQAARNIQKMRRAQNGRRKYEKTQFAYMAFSVACSQLKRWIHWNDLRVEDLFAELDLDKSGKVTTDEMNDFFKSHPSVELSPKDIEAIVYHLDPNNNGFVLYKEFVRIIKESDQISDQIKENWKRHLREQATSILVRDMANAWKDSTRDADLKDLSAAERLLATRKRRDSRWAAEFELLKSRSEKQNQQHKRAQMNAEQRRIALHKEWRIESKRRIERANTKRKKYQLKLMADHSNFLQSDDNENEDGLGKDGIYDQQCADPSKLPSRPAGKPGSVPTSLSPNMKKRSIYKRPIRPQSPTEVLKNYNFWERKKDKKSHRIFYCNVNTREVRWTLPKDGHIWPPPPPPEDGVEETRISPFTGLKSASSISPKNNSYNYKNMPRSSLKDFESKDDGIDLELLASQMESFGSLRWDVLTSRANRKNTDECDVEEDDNKNRKLNNSNTNYDKMYHQNGDEHRKHTHDRVINRHTAISAKNQHHQHTQERLEKRKKSYDLQNKPNNTEIPNSNDHSMKDEQAAIKLEAVERGRRDRAKVKKMREDESRKAQEAANAAAKRSNKPIPAAQPKFNVVIKKEDGPAKPNADFFNLHPSEEELRSYLVMIKAELNRELHHTKPTKKELHDMKRDFGKLGTLIPDENTLIKLGIFVDCKRISEQSINPKIRKFAATVVDNWLTKYPDLSKSGGLVISINGGPPKPHPNSFNLHPTQKQLVPYLIMLQSELNREAHHKDPTKNELRAMRKMFLELVEMVPDENTLNALNIYNDCKKIMIGTTNKKVKKYSSAVVDHWEEIFPKLKESK